MKKIITILFLSCLVMPLFAQYGPRLNHRFGAALEAGWSQLWLGSSLSPKTNVAPSLGGWFGGGELVYEMEYNHFLARFAVASDYTNNWNRFDAPSQSRTLVEYPTMTYIYDFSNFKQKTAYANLNIPIMVGAEFNTFYFLVGTKLGLYPFRSSTKSSVDAHVWGIDEDVIDPIYGLYTHDMGDYSFAGQKQPLRLNGFGATASVEVGLVLDKQIEQDNKRMSKDQLYKELHRKKTFEECIHYKVALFADYGLTDMYSYQPNAVAYQTANGFESDGGLIDIPQTNTALPNSIYGYEPNKNDILHNLFVGLRCAIMYQVPPQPPTSGTLANPHIIVMVNDGLTGEPLKGAAVQMCGLNPKNGRPQIVNKNTGGKFNNVDRACVPGKYDFSVSYPGYLPFDTIGFDHGYEFDTLFVLLYPPVNMTVDVVDAQTGKSIKSTVTIHDPLGNKVKNMAMDSGFFDTVTLSTGLKYRFCAKSKGYFDTCFISTQNPDRLTIALSRIPPRKFVLKYMYFATDQTEVLPISQNALNMLYSFLNENPDVTIRIIGHTDDIASDAYNQKLSEGRANAVKAEMVQRGIDEARMQTVGKGESEPVVPNDSDENRQMNRRVEIEIISGDVKIELLQEIF